MWPPLLYSDLPYHIIYLPLLGPTLVILVISVISHTPTRPYSTQRPLTQPIPTLTYPTISYLPLLDPTMVISVIPMVISVISVVISVISVFPATRADLQVHLSVCLVLVLLCRFRCVADHLSMNSGLLNDDTTECFKPGHI